MIDAHYFYLITLVLVIGTLIIRGGFIAFSHKVNISPMARELFTYIPAAILPCLIFPGVFFDQGNVEWLGGKERLLVIVVSFMLTYFIRNTLFCITTGLALLYWLMMSH